MDNNNNNKDPLPPNKRQEQENEAATTMQATTSNSNIEKKQNKNNMKITTDDDTPVHCAMIGKRPVNTVLKLLNTYPEAINYKNANNKYPLELAITYKYTFCIISKIIDIYNTLEVDIHEEPQFQYLLHEAICIGYSEDVIFKLIDTFPQSIKLKKGHFLYSDGHPLHLACDKDHKQSITVVKRLIDEFPEAVQLCDKYYNYPLHIACGNDSMELIIFQLLDVFPQAVSKPNIRNQLPLHCACRCKNQSETVLMKLIDEYPKAVTQTDYDGLPLHSACENNQSERVVLRLLDMYSQAATVPQSYPPCYPLHLACQSNQSDKVILKLIHLYPRATLCMKYPLEYACISGVSDRVLLTLINCNLAAAIPINRGDTSPLEHYKNNGGKSKTFIKVLEDLMKIPLENLSKRCNIPTSILCALSNGTRDEIFNWLLSNTPNILVNGEYVHGLSQELYEKMNKQKQQNQREN